MKIVRLLMSTLSCGGFVLAASAEVVRVPSSFVSLSPPPGHTALRGFPGFENRRAGWTIKVLELGPEVWPEYAAALSSPERANSMFGPEGVRIERIEQLALDSGDVPVAIGVEESLGRELVTYIALVGDRRANPVLIIFELSRSSSLGRNDIEAVLRSVRNDRPTTLAGQVAALPFAFRDAPPFHTTFAASGPTRAESATARLAAFDDGVDSSKWLTIAISYSGPSGNRPAETAQTNAILIRGPLKSSEPTIVEQRAVAFAGGPGDFIVATAGGRTVFHFLRVLPDDTQVRFSAIGESRAIEGVRTAIMDIASSVELRE